MAIADVKDNQSLQRDILVRITFAFRMSSYITLQSGTTYRSTYPLGFEVITAKEDGNTVSVSNTAGANGDLFEVTTSSAVGQNNPLIGYFYKYYTSGLTQFLDRDDPTGAVSNLVEWKSGILRGINVKESMGALIDGRLSLSSSSISLTDTELEIENMLNYEHDDYGDFLNDISLANQNIDIWIGFDNNFDLVFKGRMADVTFNGYNVNINLKDGFREFISAAYCGDDESESIMKVANYPNIDENSIDGKPIRFFLGHTTPFRGARTTIASSSYSDRTLVISELPDCYNIDYQQAYGAAKNDKWVLGRFPTGQFRTTSYTLSIVSQNRTNHGANTWQQIWVSAADGRKIHCGMLITVTFSDDTTAQVPVHSVEFEDSTGPFTDIAWFSFVHTTNLALKSGVDVTVDHPWGIVYKVTGGTWGNVIDNTNQIDQTNCTVTKTATSGGHELVSVELTAATPAAVDGATEFKFYSVQNDTVELHTMMKELVEGAGYTTDATSFASSVAGKDCVLAVPNLTKDTYPTYLEVLSQVINSTLFTITFDTDEKVYLNNFGEDIVTPGAVAVDYTLYEEDIIDGSFSWSYQTSNITPNIRNSCSYFKDKKVEGSAIYNFEWYEYQQLHKTSQTKNYDTVFPSGDELYSSAISDIAKAPRRIYRFSLPMKYYDMQLGEKILLDSSIKYINSDRSMLIMSITRSLTSISVEAYLELNN